MNKNLKKGMQFVTGGFFLAKRKVKNTLGLLQKEGIFNEEESTKVASEVLIKTKEQVSKKAKMIKSQLRKDVQEEDAVKEGVEEKKKK